MDNYKNIKLVNCVSRESEAMLKMSRCDVITLACEALSKGQLDESKVHLHVTIGHILFLNNNVDRII